MSREGKEQSKKMGRKTKLIKWEENRNKSSRFFASGVLATWGVDRTRTFCVCVCVWVCVERTNRQTANHSF